MGKIIAQLNITPDGFCSHTNVVDDADKFVISQLARLRLMDEYYFVVQPMIAGRGKRLFEALESDKTDSLTLADTRIFKSGAVALRYIHADR